MNTPEITAPAVQAWLKQQLADTLLDVSAVHHFELDISTKREADRAVMAFGYISEDYRGTISGTGRTVLAAVTKLLEDLPSTAELAAQKRAEAAKLIAEAESLESA